MLEVPSFVVIGGGVDGAYYVRQLLRAVAARKLATGRIVVIDRRADCAASKFADSRVEVAVSEWSDWLDRHLHELPTGSHLVPYHWAPHLLVEWLRRTVEKAGRRADAGGPMPSLGLPFEHETKSGDRALSYATWTCPVTCIEPALCPHTRGPKDWSLARDLSRAPAGFDGALVFSCLHLVWGVGSIPVDSILEIAHRVVAAPGEHRYSVATSSHCHALATTLRVS